ncbi:hypothetical protein CR513_09415, partial [Mucuna pruriens]
MDFHMAKERRERGKERERRVVVVSELSSLKGVLLARIIEGNKSRMVSMNGTNYHLWKGKVKDLLFLKKMHLLIESLYISKYGNNKLFLLNSIMSLKFKKGTSLLDHLNEIQGIINQMSEMGIKFEVEILGLLLLNSLPESWETFKVSITNSAPNGVVSLQMVKGSVLNKEMRRKAQGSSSQSEVLVIENRGRSQKKEREKSKSKSKSRYKNKNENKGKKGKSKEKDDDDDDDRATTTTSDDLVILRDFDSINLVSDESMWIIDSGATLQVTLQVTPMKEFFTSYTSGDFGVLKMGNDGVTKVISIGDVCLQTNTRMQLWCKGVKHAPDVCFNLISVYMLDDGGYDNHFVHGKWKLTKGNLVVARGEKISKLYWIKALVAKESMNAMDMEASLWHRRLSHISEKGLNCLDKKDMLPRLKNASSLKESKDQVLEKFKHFHSLVERQLGKKVKCIRSNNGGQYCGPFDVYCKQQSIKHEKTPPKTP